MRKFFTGAVLALALALLPQAARAETISVNVNGLVCAFCAVAVEKTFGAMAAIKSVKVDLEGGLVTLVTKPDQTLTDKEISDTMTDAGYTVTGVKRGA